MAKVLDYLFAFEYPIAQSVSLDTMLRARSLMLRPIANTSWASTCQNT